MNVGLLSPGEMGSAVAVTLREQGVTVLTCLEGRSARTRDLAERDRLEVAPTLADLVLASDVILSIVPPASALDVARAVTAAIRATGARPLYVDCNAVSPSTVRAVAATVGGEVVDIGIIGSPPRGQGTTRFYASGPQASHLELPGLDVRPIGEEVGTASALKMCYAALTKGFTALATELLVAARLLGVNDELAKELADSQAQHHATMARQIPRMPSVAHRWSCTQATTAHPLRSIRSLKRTSPCLESSAETTATLTVSRRMLRREWEQSCTSRRTASTSVVIEFCWYTTLAK